MKVYNTIGAQYVFRWNTVVPPFNDEQVRRAAMYAFDQMDFLEGRDRRSELLPALRRMFVCGTPLENSAGMEGLVRANFARSKELLKEAGYDGTPIVMLHTTDIAVLTNAGPIAKDAAREGRLQGADGAARLPGHRLTPAAQDAAGDGGWNGFMTAWLSVDMMNPLTNSMVNASCEKANFGWPCDAEVERLRDAFARAPDLPARQKIAAELQARAVQYGTHIHLGQYTLPTATRAASRHGQKPDPGVLEIEKK